MSGPNKNAKLGGVYPDGDAFIVRYYVLGADFEKVRKKKTGFTKKGAASQFFEEKCDEYRKACDNAKESTITFREYLIGWFEDIYQHEIRNSTETTFRYTLYNYILPELDDVKMLKDVDKKFVDALIKAVFEQRPSYAKKVKELFSACLLVAKKDNLIRHNFMDKVRVPRYEKKKVVIFRKAQIKDFLELAKQTSLYLEFLLALMMGLRKGEVYGVRIADFDFEKKTVHLKKQIVYEVELVQSGQSRILKSIARPVETNLKTDGSERVLKVPDFILKEVFARIETIERQKKKLGDEYKDNGYLCGRIDGTARAGSCLNGALNKITDKMGAKRMAFHYLRHNAATIMLEQGVDLATISKILGHTSMKTTYQFYCEIMEAKEEMADILDNEYGDLVSFEGVQ